MATQTAGRVFQWATRFVGTSGGMAVRLTTPLSRISAGLVRFTHGPCGVLKSKQTATPIEWPPDRRIFDMNASPFRPGALQHLIDSDTTTIHPERLECLNQTAPPRLSQTANKMLRPNENREDETQTTAETQIAEPTRALSDLPTHERSPPQDNLQTCLTTDRCKNKSHLAPLSQNKREQALADPTPEVSTNTTEKVTHPRKCCAHSSQSKLFIVLTARVDITVRGVG